MGMGFAKLVKIVRRLADFLTYDLEAPERKVVLFKFQISDVLTYYVTPKKKYYSVRLYFLA